MKNSLLENIQQSGDIENDIIVMELKELGKADFRLDKLTKYALNPLVDRDKATAFEESLGYNLSNVDELVKNIKDNLSKFDVEEKSDIGYGQRFQVILNLVGVNGKNADVLTAWIKDKVTGKIRLTSVYVKKRKKRG